MVIQLAFYFHAGWIIGLAFVGGFPGMVLGSALGIALFCLLYSR